MNLDYSLYTDKERIRASYEYIEHNPQLYDLEKAQNAHDLEQLANYILYGKDESKLTNAVQQKRILPPQTKHSTYNRKPVESLDELVESPLFEQSAARPYDEKNTYLHPRPAIKRPKYAADGTIEEPNDAIIPGMVELWSEIDELDHLLDIYKGDALPANAREELAQQWDSIEAYKIKHWLIDLRKHQYHLKESFRPTIPSAFTFTRPGTIDWESNSGHWEQAATSPDLSLLKICAGDEKLSNPNYTYYKYIETNLPAALWRQSNYTGKWEYFVLLREHYIDFTNPRHIYCLLEHYDELKKSSYDDINGQMKHILIAFEEIGQRTELSPVHEFILDSKVIKWTNRRIRDELQVKYGVNYNENYISTIYKHNICNALAATAALMEREFENRNNPLMWKHCSVCHRKLLLDPYNFVRKSDTRDGYSSRCKLCDKKVRKQKTNK